MRTKVILVVEDEKTLREALKEKLTHEDFNVLEAANGQVGLDLAIKEKPDLILLDIVMPVMDGFTMVHKLREAEQATGELANNQIPVIFLTNLSEETNFSKAQKEGVYNFLVKSNWSLDSLVKKIKDVLKM